MYIIIAILAFGILIGLHEFGHFAAAKLCGVKVNEFSVGMGPALLKKQGKETLYALRLLPIGGFCSMEGEDEETGDPRAFSAQNHVKRILILVAGPLMNFITGAVIVFILFSGSTGYVGNTITKIEPTFPSAGEAGLMEGDRIISVNGDRVYYSSDFTTFMGRAGSTVDIVVQRGSGRVLLDDYELVKREYPDEDGTIRMRYGISFNIIKANLGENIKYSAYTSYNFVRLIRMSLADLIHGLVSVKELSGPVGIVSVMNDIGKEADSARSALTNIAYLCAFIAVNLAVMNMLPIPALDGGRVFLLIVTWIVETVFRRRIDPKYEGYIHTAGLVLMMGLMVVVMFNDVVKIFRG